MGDIVKSYKVIIPMCVMTFLSACGGASDSSEKKSSANDVSSSVVTNAADLKLDEELLANKNNTAGNGYIIINDEEDYPDFVKDLRYVEKLDNDLYSIRDFAGNELFTFESEKYSLCFSEGISHFCKDGKWGFVDLNGNIIIEPQYDGTGSFFNGTCYVQLGSDEFFIDKNGEKADDRKYLGFEGSLDELKEMLGENSWFSKFTGTYMGCGRLAQSEDEQTVFGYADKDGNFTEIKEDFGTNFYSFYNGYAAIETNFRKQLYFIDENLKRVTGNIYDICNDEFVPIDFLNDGMLDREYVFEGGYFISTLKSDDPLGERKVIKIAPELYKAE